MLAKKITSNKSSDSVKKFKYKDKGMMATIGGFKAIGVIGKLKISGFTSLAFLELNSFSIFNWLQVKIYSSY
jgi:NADH dehydrogenase FAD-containing subunit